MKAWMAIVAVVAASLAGAAPPLLAADLDCVETGAVDCCELECGDCPCCVQAPAPELGGPAPVARERPMEELAADELPADGDILLIRLPDEHIGYLLYGSTMGQWLSIPMFAVGLVWVAVILTRHFRQRPAAA